MHHPDRQELRRLAESEGMTESALVREAVALLLSVVRDADEHVA